MKKKHLNTFWAVYDNKQKFISISKVKTTAQEEALRLSSGRWTYQTFNEDWKRLKKKGYFVVKSFIQPIR